MKKMTFLAVVGSLAFLAAAASAAAQAPRPENRVATVACRGYDVACVTIDLYQKVADSAGQTKTAAGQKASSATANSKLAVRNPRNAGGVENNPADDSGAAAMAKLRKNADKQRRLVDKNAAKGPGAKADRAQKPAATKRERNRLVRRGDDPVVNNPDAASDTTAKPQRPQAAERRVRQQRDRFDTKAPYAIKARKINRHNPTPF